MSLITLRCGDLAIDYDMHVTFCQFDAMSFMQWADSAHSSCQAVLMHSALMLWHMLQQMMPLG